MGVMVYINFVHPHFRNDFVPLSKFLHEMTNISLHTLLKKILDLPLFYKAFVRFFFTDNFTLDQCFLVLEFAIGGHDLEHFEFKSYSEALSVLQQITLSLAVAESSLEFEHRDLHWGNVLIIRNDQQEIDYCLNGQAIKINSHGVHASIIDFTLSRLRKGKYMSPWKLLP
jgi:serine/threonine protein kinase